MKKTFRFALMAVLTVGLSFAVTSCKDDDNDNSENNGGTEAVDDQTSLEEYQQRSTMAKFAGIDASDVVLTKTYEPEIGVVDDEAKPNVRSIAVGTLEKADETAVMLLSALGIDATNPAGFSYSSDMVGTASYQHGGGDANTLATISLALKQMPGLVQLRLTKTAGENANRPPRYKMGDIVKYKDHYWVCVSQAAAYKDNAYFVTFDHTGDMHATSTFSWSGEKFDTYWQHDTPMADSNILDVWLKNCVLNDFGWNLVKGNYEWATSQGRGAYSDAVLEQMIPTTAKKRRDMVMNSYYGPDSLNRSKEIVTYTVTKSQTSSTYAMKKNDVWETYDGGNGKLKVPTILLCNTTRYSLNLFSSNQFWVPYIFMCRAEDCVKTEAQLKAIKPMNASKFKYEITSSKYAVNSEALKKELLTDEVAIMVAAYYWEHEFYEGNNWLQFDFTKDWRQKTGTSYTNDDVWISRCVTSKSVSVVDKGVTPKGYEDIYVATQDDMNRAQDNQ